MNDVPITFEYKGKIYKGFFSAVSGGGANVWHLMINNYYYGVLVLTEKYGWKFHGNAFEDMGEYFGNYMVLWYE